MLLSYLFPMVPPSMSLDLARILLPTLEPQNIMMPYVLDETLVRLFKYWDRDVQLGMQYGQELYTYLQSFASHERLDAYTLAFLHIEKGYHVCITVSKKGYSVWKSLRQINTNTDHKNREVQTNF